MQFFHLDESEQPNNELLSESDAAQLLACLQRHQNLKALALIVRNCYGPLGSTREGQGSPWPKLKALYLHPREGQHWLEELPKFDELQILSLHTFGPIASTIDQNVMENFAKCRHLRVLDLDFILLDNIEALRDIAHACPLLQRLSVAHVRLRGEPSVGQDYLFDVDENLLYDLLRALPRLEFLALDLKFKMDGALLFSMVTRHCPRLTVLDLWQSEICFALGMMTDLDPLWQLETMSFATIYFEDVQLKTLSLPKIYFKKSRRLLHSNYFKSLATEWRRIFPRLRGMPCPQDGYPPYMFEDDSDEESDGDHASVSAEEELRRERRQIAIYEAHCCILRIELWSLLGYDKVGNIYDRIPYMWQTDLEIEVVGWPVVPLRAFLAPDSYSTTAK